jgi:hypothetical protein
LLFLINLNICFLSSNDFLKSFQIHRELPGFGSTRLLIATVSTEIDVWKSQVGECVADVFDLYRQSGVKLAVALSPQVGVVTFGFCLMLI